MLLFDVYVSRPIKERGQIIYYESKNLRILAPTLDMLTEYMQKWYPKFENVSIRSAREISPDEVTLIESSNGGQRE